LWCEQGRQQPATRAIRLAARASKAGNAGKGGSGRRRVGLPGGTGDSPCGAGGFCLAARLTTVDGARN